MERLAGGLDSLSDALDFLFQVVFLDRAEVRAVHLDALGLGQVAAKDAVDEILEVVEAVTVLADEGFAVARMDLEARAVVGFLRLDGRRETEVSEHRVENFGR